MTKRLTLAGIAAVAVVWGPFVYAELVREPASTVPESEDAADARQFAAPEPSMERPAAARVARAETITAAEPSAEPVQVAPEPAAEPVAVAEPAIEPPVALPEPPHPPEPAQEAPAAEPAAAEAVAAETHEEHAAPEGTSDAVAKNAALVPEFSSTFDREARDGAWAADEEPRITEVLTGFGLPSNAISDVSCKQTVCRVALDARAADTANPAQLFQLYQRVRAEFGPSLAIDVPRDEGARTASFYVLRKGYVLNRGDSL